MATRADSPVFCTHCPARGGGLDVAFAVGATDAPLPLKDLGGIGLGTTAASPLIGFDLPRALRLLVDAGYRVGPYALDLATELRALDNGRTAPKHVTAEYAAARCGLDVIGVAAIEHQFRDGPIVAADILARQRLEFVSASYMKLEPELHLGRALHRGEYLVAHAWMEHTGLPIDVRWYGAVQACLSSLVREAKTRAGQYPGGHATLADYADSEKLLDSWPRIRTGQLSTSRRAFRVMSARDPRLNQIVADLKLAAGLDVPPLAPDADGRLRFDARPFSSITGRNQPRSANYIFAHSNWYRALIAPPPGYAHVYLDWEAQEYGIAAALSQDPVMCGFYREGDPYEAMAVKTGAAGPGRVDPIVRARQKTVALGTLYGMGPGLLAQRLKVSEAEAVEILRGHRRLHPRFWRWSQDVVAAATFTGQISSVFGWPMTVTSATKVTTLMNFPIQANAAEMLRLACILAHRRGVTMLATVHDAILVEARIDDVGSVVAEMRDCMARASRAVLDGFELRVDSTVTPWPEHWAVSDNTTLQHVAERCGWPL